MIVSVYLVAYKVDSVVLESHLKEEVLRTATGYIHYINELLTETSSSIIRNRISEEKILRQNLQQESIRITQAIETYDRLAKEGIITQKQAEQLALSYIKKYTTQDKSILLLSKDFLPIYASNNIVSQMPKDPMFREAISGERTGNIYYTYNGNDYIIGWSTYKPWQWTVGVLINTSKIPSLSSYRDFVEEEKKILKERLVGYSGKGYYLVIYNSKGDVISHLYTELNKDDLPSSKEIKRVFSEGYGYFFYKVNNKEKLKIFSYFPVFDWYIVLTFFPQQHLKPILWKILKEELLPLSIVMLIFAVIILIYINKRVISPLSALKDGFKKLKNSQFGHQIDIRSTDEMQSIIEDFNEMSRNVALHYDELKAAYRELEAIHSELEAKDMEVTKERNRLKILVEITNRSFELNDKKEIASTVIKVLKREKGYKNIDISLLKDGNLTPLSYTGYSIDLYHKMPADIGIRGWAIATKELKNVPDVSKEPHYYMGDTSIKSELSCPIIYQDKVLGIIDVESDEPASFDRDDEQTFKLIAHYLAMAFIKIDILDAWKNRTEELAFMIETIREANKASSIREIAKTMITKLVEERGYKNAIFYTRKGDKLFAVYSHGYHVEEGKIAPWEVLYINGKGIISRAARTAEPQNVPDVLKDPDYITGDERIRSELAAPVVVNGDVVGVIDVEMEEISAFTAEDEKFLSTLANELSMVISKINALEELQNAYEDLSLKEEELEASMKEIESYSQLIEKQKTELQKAYLDTIRALSKTIEMKDPYTENHSTRVAEYSIKIAKLLGLRGEEILKLNYAALLHDIGKIGIKGSILNKKDKLTPEEYEEVKKHPEIGAKILQKVRYLHDIVPIVLYHHERWDGKGYPKGLKGEEIPLLSRIIAVADTFDAMRSDRPYRKALPLKMVIREIRKNAGKQFDPKIAAVFVEFISKKFGIEE